MSSTVESRVTISSAMTVIGLVTFVAVTFGRRSIVFIVVVGIASAGTSALLALHLGLVPAVMVFNFGLVLLLLFEEFGTQNRNVFEPMVRYLVGAPHHACQGKTGARHSGRSADPRRRSRCKRSDCLRVFLSLLLRPHLVPGGTRILILEAKRLHLVLGVPSASSCFTLSMRLDSCIPSNPCFQSTHNTVVRLRQSLQTTSCIVAQASGERSRRPRMSTFPKIRADQHTSRHTLLLSTPSFESTASTRTQCKPEKGSKQPEYQGKRSWYLHQNQGNPRSLYFTVQMGLRASTDKGMHPSDNHDTH